MPTAKLDITMSASADSEATTWYAVWSEKSNREYYYNPVTQESTWVLPSDEPVIFDYNNETFNYHNPDSLKSRRLIRIVSILVLVVAIVVLPSLKMQRSSKDQTITPSKNNTAVPLQSQPDHWQDMGQQSATPKGDQVVRSGSSSDTGESATVYLGQQDSTNNNMDENVDVPALPEQVHSVEGTNDEAIVDAIELLASIIDRVTDEMINTEGSMYHEHVPKEIDEEAINDPSEQMEHVPVIEESAPSSSQIDRPNDAGSFVEESLEDVSKSDGGVEDLDVTDDNLEGVDNDLSSSDMINAENEADEHVDDGVGRHDNMADEKVDATPPIDDKVTDHETNVVADDQGEQALLDDNGGARDYVSVVDESTENEIQKPMEAEDRSISDNANSDEWQDTTEETEIRAQIEAIKAMVLSYLVDWESVKMAASKKLGAGITIANPLAMGDEILQRLKALLDALDEHPRAVSRALHIPFSKLIKDLV